MKYFLRGLCLFILFCLPTQVQAEIKAYFSPNGGCQEAVVAEINKAQKSINIAMYSFTSREIAQAVLTALERHVKVRIVLDKAQKNEHYSKSRYLISKGVDIKYHLGPGLMHNKFSVIDGQEVLTGSFNWTASAEKRNDENLLILTDKELAEKYTNQFKYLWSQSGEDGLKEVQSESKE